MTPSCVYDTYWRFAAERQAMYLRRLGDLRGPWTADPFCAITGSPTRIAPPTE